MQHSTTHLRNGDSPIGHSRRHIAHGVAHCGCHRLGGINSRLAGGSRHLGSTLCHHLRSGCSRGPLICASTGRTAGLLSSLNSGVRRLVLQVFSADREHEVMCQAMLCHAAS